ncbi:MAG: hypothetical protein DA407_08145 [Bacteroidetes bacterium]|nr:MAG: hypothetical protein DA407_08145 [Bacteroidota bacterium]
MKKVTLFILLIIAFTACKQEPKTEDYTEKELDVSTSIYPESISKIFEAHGGIDAWNAFESLYFEIEKPEGNDKYDVALKSRKSLIISEHHLLGFDGENVWLKNLDTVTYKSNPKFYYNLMFYFYAMPFVLGDDGINYSEVDALEFEGVNYPGILISYNDGVGESPEDEYILYYHPETHKMEWLGYTVTYFSKEKGKEFHFIKYSDWQDGIGVLLPKTLTWYNYEDNKPTTLRNAVNFVNLKLSKEMPNEEIFKVPDNTMIVE